MWKLWEEKSIKGPCCRDPYFPTGVFHYFRKLFFGQLHIYMNIYFQIIGFVPIRTNITILRVFRICSPLLNFQVAKNCSCFPCVSYFFLEKKRRPNKVKTNWQRKTNWHLIRKPVSGSNVPNGTRAG